jgi:predicted Ser/Thr protein kinase
MIEGSTLIDQLSQNYQDLYHKRRVILTFGHFLELAQKNPRRFTRNSADYLLDTFAHFGESQPGDTEKSVDPVRYSMFDLGTERNGPVIGGEVVQSEIKNILESFARRGYTSKLILLHGPNGSAKSSTVESIARGMQQYSESEEGAVYRFNWVFPSDKSSGPIRRGESGPIGFGAGSKEDRNTSSYALLDETKIASKITSEFRENPLYLIPREQRETWLKNWMATKDGGRAEDMQIPPHMLLPGLSKRNQEIFENLLNAYAGNLNEVFRHVQIERFFYSRQYRVGISTVEPQMSIDAHEKQLTLDKNISNLPSVLNTMSFYLSQGEIVEANRGILEFSDLLKRPIEAFKYLLSTIEKGSVNLPSGTANLDIVFLGTTNEKHLDSFKTSPDFGSFKGRFELVTVPYLLRSKLEQKIYKSDIEILKKVVKICPHTLESLCNWAVMTRYKQPDPEQYDRQHRSLIAKLDPRSKARLYDDEDLEPAFNSAEQKILRSIRRRILAESKGMVVYEGRFGASPREVRVLLHRAAQKPNHRTLTPMAIFEELESLIKDRTVFEFLQFEPRGKYHDVGQFISIIKDEFADTFERECIASMILVEDQEYEHLLKRYVDNVVAEIKKSKLWDPSTSTYIEPSKAIMADIEKILSIKIQPEKYREHLLSRIASYKIENPDKNIDVNIVLQDMLLKIRDHFNEKNRGLIEANYRTMLSLGRNDESELTAEELTVAKDTFAELSRRFGYDQESAVDCLKFLINRRAKT